MNGCLSRDYLLIMKVRIKMEDQKTCSVEKYNKGFCDEPAEWKLKYKHYPEALFCVKHKRMVDKLLIGKRRWSRITD